MTSHFKVLYSHTNNYFCVLGVTLRSEPPFEEDGVVGEERGGGGEGEVELPTQRTEPYLQGQTTSLSKI